MRQVLRVMAPVRAIAGAAASEPTHQTPRCDVSAPFVPRELSLLSGLHGTVAKLFYKCVKVTATQATLDTTEESECVCGAFGNVRLLPTS